MIHNLAFKTDTISSLYQKWIKSTFTFMHVLVSVLVGNACMIRGVYGRTPLHMHKYKLGKLKVNPDLAFREILFS